MTRLCTCSLAAACLLAAAPLEARTNWEARIRLAADRLLAQQTPHGCTPDAPGGIRANKDSNMCYALLALAHAYRVTGSARFRRGLRSGIEWLASRMESRQKGWVGSWRFAYAARPPDVALPTPPGEGIEDARGVSATSALFAYLLALYTEATGDATLASKYKPHARAALDFVLERNRGPNDLFYSSWHRLRGDGRWTLYRMQYTADQADVYLGLRGGYHLLHSRRYKLAAEKLERQVPKLLYHRGRRVFGIAYTPRGTLVPPDEGWKGHFVQGYVAWVFGSHDETRHAVRWLRDRQAPDGSFRRKKGQPAYALSAALFALGSAQVKDHRIQRLKAKRWLRDVALTPKGGIRDFGHTKAPIYNNLAGWVVAAWANAPPFPAAATEEPGAPIWGWRYYYWYTPRRR